jgi:ribosome maturation factor RimP
MNVEEKVKKYVEDALEGTNLFIVDLKFLPKNRVLIILDGDAGIKIEECAKVSRYVSNKMEEDNLIEAVHTLEVSSPGVDYPLKYARQYPQHIGRTLAIRMNDGKEWEGKLEQINGDVIGISATIKVKGKKPTTEPKEFSLTEIKEAKIKIVF